MVLSKQTLLKGLGYKNEVGYETFLYGSEVEIRRLLIFLIEKLPKEIDQKTDDSGTGKSS